MPFNGAGIFSRTPGTRIANQGALVSAQVNDETDNLVDGINGKVNLDGLLTMTGLQLLFGDGTALLHGATVSQAMKGILGHSTAVGGTVDAIQITMTPAVTTWTLNEVIRWKSGGANTIAAPTVSKDAGVSTKIIKKGASVALAPGDLGTSGYECEGIYNGTDVLLQNPASIPVFQTKGADLASAGTVTVLDDGDYVHVTGTTGITDIDFTTVRNGKSIKVIFDGVLTLTHNGTTLKLPGNANITTAAGDRAEFVQDSSDNVICLWYTRAASAPGSGGIAVIRRQVFTADGTYTPHASMLYCTVTATGGGGGSGGSNGSNNGGATGGAGAGATCRETFSAATIGASQTVTVGTGGAGGATGNNTGADGEDTTFGALMTAGGGKLSVGTAGIASLTTPGGNGGTASGGEINITGGDGGNGWAQDNGVITCVGGQGGASFWGGGPRGGHCITGGSDGVAGKAYGTGGSGCASNSVTAAGANGANGVVEVIEYCSA